MTRDTLNAKEVSILAILETSDKPLWKRKIHRRLLQEEHRLPIEGRCSVQTVGRRVDRLYEAGRIEAVPVASKEVNRALITGYRLTEGGEEALNEARDRALRESTIEYLGNAINGGREPSTNAEFLLDAFASRYDVPRERLEDLDQEDHLYGFLALFYSSTSPLGDVYSQDEFCSFVQGLRESDAAIVSDMEDAFTPLWA